MNVTRVILGCWAYGFVRNAVYAPKMKKDEYIVDRIGNFAMWTAASPILIPTYMCQDLRNLERSIRKLPGKVNTWPWVN